MKTIRSAAVAAFVEASNLVAMYEASAAAARKRIATYEDMAADDRRAYLGNQDGLVSVDCLRFTLQTLYAARAEAEVAAILEQRARSLQTAAVGDLAEHGSNALAEACALVA